MQYGYAEYVYLSACLEQVKDDYDIIIIDTPPAKNNLTLSAIYAADDVIIPLKADQYSMESLTETIAMIRSLEKTENININILGILLTIVEKTALARSLKETLSEGEFKDFLFNTEIRKAQAVNESTVYSMPVVMYDAKSNPSLDYEALYYEIEAKEKK
jgi:chromosome partitioning protein